MSWKPESDEIERRRAAAREQGGADAVAKQHARGRLTVRERIGALVDAESFREHGEVAGQVEVGADGRERFTPANVVVGTARIDARPVVVAGDDFTIRGGSYSPAGLRKGIYGDELAVRRRIPLVRLLEGGGASVAGATGVRGRSGYDWVAASPLNLLCMEALATVPVVCVALGPVAGFPAARLVASHLSIMTRGAQVLTGGPALVERATGRAVSKEELGGAQVHLRSGVVDNLAEDEADAWRQVKAFLGYLPSNAGEAPPRFDGGDPPGRREEELVSLVPRERRRAYKVRRAIEAVVDRGSFFEMGALYGRSQVTGLARLAGRPVGVLANDCHHEGGSMTADGARKVRRFAELCDGMSLPIVSLVDEPGFWIGPEAERAGTIRFGMEAMFAVLQTEVPWAAVVMRRAFGVALGIHLGPSPTVIAWPSAQSGSMPVEGGVELAYGREIAAAPDPEARRRELEEELAAAQSVFPRAEDFGVHHLIDPRDTRPVLCDWLDEIEPRLRQLPLRGPRRYGPRP
ncbi:MAG TPA: carboxyl transferase domain-containing protein [Myxococcota bacterium]|nr:carboxyl transferase domain-containing protein [Myxococcota bacterium]